MRSDVATMTEPRKNDNMVKLPRYDLANYHKLIIFASTLKNTKNSYYERKTRIDEDARCRVVARL